MVRALKWAMWIGVALVATILLIVALLARFWSPDYLRPQIEAALTRQLGRAVTLDPGLNWRLGRVITLRIPGVRIANAPGFRAETPLLSLTNITLPVAWRPLLRHRIELGLLDIQNLRVNLQRNSARNNWSEVVNRLTTGSDSDYRLTASAGLVIHRADVSYATEEGVSLGMSDATWRVDALQILEDGVMTKVKGSGVMASRPAANAAGWRGRVQCEFNLMQGAGQLEFSDVALQLRDLQRETGLDHALHAVDMRLDALRWDTALQTLKWRRLLIESAGATAQLDGQSTVSDALQLETALSLHAPQLRSTAQSWRWSLPKTRDPGALQSLHAELNVSVEPSATASDQLISAQVKELWLDDTRVNGALRFSLGDQAAQAQLHADQLNLDRYVPAAETSSTPQPVPLQWLRALNVRGELNVGELRMQDLRGRNARLVLEP